MGVSEFECNKNDMMLQRLRYKSGAICYKYKCIYKESSLTLHPEIEFSNF